MTPALKITFEEYLRLEAGDLPDGRFEYVDGELRALPPESGLNSTIAVRILLLLVAAGVPVELIHPGKCEVQVPVLQNSDAANRFPDLVVLRPEHLPLTQRRLTLTLEMPPPRLVVEIVSPGKPNRARDYLHKRAQYAAIGIPEYWLVDPQQQQITILELQNGLYVEGGVFSGQEVVVSPAFPKLTFTAEQVLIAGA